MSWFWHVLTALRPRHGWWRGQTLRGRITLVATALLTGAVITGAILTVIVLRLSLTRALDSSAIRTGNDVAVLVNQNRIPNPVLADNGGIVQVQVVDGDNRVIGASPGADAGVSLLSARQLESVRSGSRLEIPGRTSSGDEPLRVVGVKAGVNTVLVATDAARIEQSVRIVRNAAIIGCPLAIIAMALLTYWVVGQTLRTVASLRHGADEITAAGLADMRLPVPGAPQDEISRLAVTLNAMLDRIDAATKRQRTFVGDAAHELRSPIASLRVQLEVAARLGPAVDWDEVISDVLIDVDRIDHLVTDLLTLARNDESGGVLRRREPVELATLVEDLVADYESARVPVSFEASSTATVDGDVDALRRVVVNLVDNAVRYASSAVKITLTRSPRQPTVELVVADDGPGISPGEREQVFDRFYRTEASRSRQFGGTGLGLPIVRDLLRAHGGTVRLGDNAPGLRAIVTLPVRPVT